MRNGILSRSLLFVATLGAFMLFAPVRSCDHDNGCPERIRRAEERLRREVDRHGEGSRQAEEKRHELEETKRACREEHRGY